MICIEFELVSRPLLTRVSRGEGDCTFVGCVLYAASVRTVFGLYTVYKEAFDGN